MHFTSCVPFTPLSVLRRQSVQVRTHHIVGLYRYISNTRLLRPACHFRSRVQEAPRCDPRTLHGRRDARYPRVGAGLAALAVLRTAWTRGSLRIAYRERVL